jgi:tetratricopeptide (TPR) repeat protein
MDPVVGHFVIDQRPERAGPPHLGNINSISGVTNVSQAVPKVAYFFGARTQPLRPRNTSRWHGPKTEDVGKRRALEMTQESSVSPKQEPEALAYRIAKAWMFRSVMIWGYGKAAVKSGISTTITLLWVLPAVLILLVAAPFLFEDRVTLEPISVPKAFSENGYTPEVASQHLRDALATFVVKANSKMPTRNVALHGELPTMTVPKVGLSLDAILSSVRRLLHYGNSQTISGEFILRGKLVWLRLRINGRQVYDSQIGVDPDNADQLLTESAPAIIEEIRPYLFASFVYESDKEKALEKAEAIISRLPQSDENVQWAYILKGVYFVDHNQFSQAEENYRNAIKLNPHNAMAHVDLGVVLMQLKKADEALIEFRTALKLDRNLAAAHIGLGLYLLEQGDLDAGMVELRRARVLEPKDAVVHAMLGAGLYQQNKLDEAIAAYRRSIEIDPRSKETHSNLGLALLRQDKPDDAVAEFRRAIEIDPKDALAYNYLGQALLSQDKLDEAIAEFRRGIEIDPRFKEAHGNLGLALLRQDKPDDAVAEFRRAIEIDPQFKEAHHYLGLALLLQDNLDDAIPEFRRVIEIDPPFKEAHNYLGFALARQDKLDDAIAEFRLAIEIDPRFKEAHDNLGAALMDQNKPDDAIAEFRLAIEIDPRFKEAHNDLGQALARQDKLDDAIAEFRRAIEIDPRFKETHNRLGVALMDQNKFDDAIAEFRRTIEIDPDNLFAQSRLDYIAASANASAKPDKAEGNYTEGEGGLGRSREQL